MCPMLHPHYTQPINCSALHFLLLGTHKPWYVDPKQRKSINPPSQVNPSFSVSEWRLCPAGDCRTETEVLPGTLFRPPHNNSIDKEITFVWKNLDSVSWGLQRVSMEENSPSKLQHGIQAQWSCCCSFTVQSRRCAGSDFRAQRDWVRTRVASLALVAAALRFGFLLSVGFVCLFVCLFLIRKKTQTKVCRL